MALRGEIYGWRLSLLSSGASQLIMITSQYCVVMAEYNSWMNAKMYALCESLTDIDRKKDLGAFFRSIHGTLNHILACDLMFLASFTKDAAFVECEGDLHEHFTELRQDRARVDARLLEWSRGVSPGGAVGVGL